MAQTKTKTARKPKEIVFRSKVANQRLVLDPSFPEFDDRGRQTKVVKGIAVVFQAGVVTIDDPGLADRLRDHHAFNEIFWEVGNEPDAQKPSVPDALGQIQDAFLDGDLTSLSRILSQEQTTHNRDTVTKAAESALAKLAERQEAELGERQQAEPNAPIAELSADLEVKPTAAEQKDLKATIKELE